MVYPGMDLVTEDHFFTKNPPLGYAIFHMTLFYNLTSDLFKKFLYGKKTIVFLVKTGTSSNIMTLTKIIKYDIKNENKVFN